MPLCAGRRATSGVSPGFSTHGTEEPILCSFCCSWRTSLPRLPTQSWACSHSPLFKFLTHFDCPVSPWPKGGSPRLPDLYSPKENTLCAWFSLDLLGKVCVTQKVPARTVNQPALISWILVLGYCIFTLVQLSQDGSCSALWGQLWNTEHLSCTGSLCQAASGSAQGRPLFQSENFPH